MQRSFDGFQIWIWPPTWARLCKTQVCQLEFRRPPSCGFIFAMGEPQPYSIIPNGDKTKQTKAATTTSLLKRDHSPQSLLYFPTG
jgi:hypothetical protein